MIKNLKHVLFCLAMIILVAPAIAQDAGRLEGTVSRSSGDPVSGVSVVIDQLGRARVTDSKGTYVFEAVPTGVYSLSFIIGEERGGLQDVEVLGGQTATASLEVDWELTFADTITVYSASRRAERIVDAPAAVTTIGEEEIARVGSHGQIPKVLEFTPGAEVTQSGVYDFNLNTRGFNSSLNRRVVTLIDGRDPSVPFLGAQEWAGLGYHPNDLAAMEFVRGPSSALYGANAFNGVLNISTKQPHLSQGGFVVVTAGELSTIKLDARWAGELSNGWYAKVYGGWTSSGDFARSRNESVEYDGLALEAVPLNPENDVKINSFGARADKHFKSGQVLTIETGLTNIEGPVFTTGIGRVQVLDIERPWTRVNLFDDRWNVLAYYNGREGNQRSTRSGGLLVLDSTNYHLEAQGNTSFADDRVRLVGGASYSEEEIDSTGPDGNQTLMFSGVESDSQAVFGQLDFDLSDRLKLVLAGRWDDSSLHDAQFSPKASAVWALNDSSSLRFTVNQGFQVANYSEFFLRAAVAPSVTALSALEDALAPLLGGVSLGFDSIPILAVGNDSLEVEEVTGFEAGYVGVHDNLIVSFDLYHNQIDNFITDLLPNVGTSLGRVNPDFGAYQAPSELPAEIQAIIQAQLAALLGPTYYIMSNAPDGSPIFAAVSYTNFGEVDTKGADLGLTWFLDGGWTVDFTASYFDFDVKQELAGDPLLSNSPEKRVAGGVTYTADGWDASIHGRWTDDFQWAAGVFSGPVPSYTSVDIATNYQLNEYWRLGLNIANAFNDRHWESFGGDILERRSLLSATYSW